jgi:hypothetical protein
MDVFLNESSLNEQFHSTVSFEKTLRQLLEMLQTFRQNGFTEPRRFFYSSSLYLTHCSPTMRFAALLKSGKKDVRDLFYLVLQQLSFNQWNSAQVHDSVEDYICGKERVTDTSFAEAACRKANREPESVFLLNFQPRFAGYVNLLVRKDGTWICLECFEDAISVERFFRLEMFNYPSTATAPPLDRQTILRDPQFIRTKFEYDGRTVYRRISDGSYWHVDGLHRGKDAEIEVYDSDKVHIGVANIEGQIIGKAKPGRFLPSGE